MKNNFSAKYKSILIGLYLSKFDEKALNTLGFEGAKQAFNVLGYSVGSKPASIKNYRDKFDPYFPNSRKGWHKRDIREYCKIFLTNFDNVSFEDFTDLIKSFVVKNYELEKFIDSIEKKDYSESIAKRLVTGSAAEEYFKLNYHLINDFQEFEIQDTTKLACGFDFKLSSQNHFYCVEVKGSNAKSGSITMTEKEFRVAKDLKERYCLFIVSNFVEKPVHQYHFDPLNCHLSFKKIERPIIQTTYSTKYD